MDALITAILNLSFKDIVSIFVLLLSTVFVFMMFFTLLKAMKGREYSRLVINPASGKLSHRKFWSNIAFILASLAFIKMNFEAGNQYIVEIWLIYLSVLGGNDMFGKWIEYKTMKSGVGYNGGYADNYNPYPQYGNYPDTPMYVNNGNQPYNKPLGNADDEEMENQGNGKSED